MADLYPVLFSPIRIGSVDIKNGIATMPMGVFSPRLMGPAEPTQRTGPTTISPGPGTASA